jgi:hypothetical protein
MIIPLGHTLPHASSDRTQRHRASNPYPTFSHIGKRGLASLFGLAPGGVYRALDVTIETGALLPHRFTLTEDTTSSGSPFSTRPRRSIFCGTFLRVTPTGRYPAPCSMEPGLSSLHPQAKSDHLISFALSYTSTCWGEQNGTLTRRITSSKEPYSAGHSNIR